MHICKMEIFYAFSFRFKFLDRIIFPKDKIVNLAYEYILEQGEGKIIGNNFMKHYILA